MPAFFFASAVPSACTTLSTCSAERSATAAPAMRVSPVGRNAVELTSAMLSAIAAATDTPPSLEEADGLWLDCTPDPPVAMLCWFA